MKERPILFSAPMVRAILDGSKTQTRRIVKHKGQLPPDWATFAQEMSNPSLTGKPTPARIFRWSEEQTPGQPLKSLRRWPGNGEDLVYDWYAIHCPYGKPGDRLWVRETWLPDPEDDGTWAYTQWAGCKGSPLSDIPERFRKPEHCIHRASWTGSDLAWTPSIHMPRWASRILLEITGVRVERLQDISEADAIAEGVKNSLHLPGGRFANENFAHLWWTINGDGSWEANPWVWVVEFKPVSTAAVKEHQCQQF